VFTYDPKGNVLSALDAVAQRTYQYSGAGDVTEFRDGENYLSLSYSADGLVAEAEDEPDYSTTFSYNGSGRALQASFSNGTVVLMDYDGLGLRRRQDYGSGGKVDYWYDPAGNLTEIKVLNADGSQHGQKLVLDGSYQIVKQTLSSGVEYTLRYDKNGNLTEVTSASSTTRFEYDSLNRLTAVVTPQGQRLTYSYAPGERSLVANYDHGASLSTADRRDTGLTFASYWDVSAMRSLTSHFGAVRYSESLGVFQLSGADGKEIVTAENSILQPLEKLRLYDYGIPLDDRIRQFQKPSNLMFLPPEYSSINCCPLCNPGDECSPCDTGDPPPDPDPPTIAIIGPSAVPLRAAGSTAPNSITLTAVPSDPGGSFTWYTNSTKVTLSNTTSETVTVTSQSQSAAANDVQISVAYHLGQYNVVGYRYLTVSKPTSLFLESDTTNPTGVTCSVPCVSGSGTCTYNSYVRTRTYVVRDQFSQLFTNLGIAQIVGTESFSGLSSTCGASAPSPSPVFLSRFNDFFAFCGTACLSGGGGCTTTATQSIQVNGFVVRTSSVSWTCTACSVTP
jgi:YD repeat-containing protein